MAGPGNSINETTTGICGFTGTAFVGTPVANHSVLVGASTSSALTNLTVGTNGQVLVGSTAADPVFATLTSSDSSISFTIGAGTLSLQVASGTGVVKTLTGNSGGAISPTAGNINTLGTGSITIAGAGSTLTTQLTGLTANSVLYGLGTATIGLVASGTTGQVLQTNTGAAPTYSTATYPSTTTVSQILYSSATNVVSGLATANRAVLTTGTTGVPVLTALATDGQVIIGSTAGAPAAATLTAGTGISITNGSNSISIANSGVATLTGQRFTATGAFTYTPTANMKFVIVELQAGGGGGGGVAATTANVATSAAGGGGGYARFILTAAQVGASLTGSVGIGGAGGSAGNNAGTNGGNTTLATAGAWTVGGGVAGAGGAAGTTSSNTGGAGGTVTTGTGTILLTAAGQAAGSSRGNAATATYAGAGGGSILGQGGEATTVLTVNESGQGFAGSGFGGGGGASFGYGTNSSAAGAAGSNGTAIFTEFV